MATTKKNNNKWIQKAVKKPGAFTAKAKKRGLTPAQFATKVRKNPNRYDPTTRRQANLAVTLRKISKKRKSN